MTSNAGLHYSDASITFKAGETLSFVPTGIGAWLRGFNNIASLDQVFNPDKPLQYLRIVGKRKP